MAVTKLLLSKLGLRAFNYLVREKENSKIKRVLAFDTIGIMQGAYEYMFNQFKSVWKRAGKQNWIDSSGAVHAMNGGRAFNQAILTIISFSNEDFPRLPGGGYTNEQIQEALEIARKIHEAMGYKQVFLVAQCDGDGGYLHVHGFVNAIDPVTNKTLVDNDRNYKRFRAISDKVIQDFGMKPLDPEKKNILSPEERAKRDDKIPADKVLFNEVLKDKIYTVMEEGFTSREEYIEKLAAVGVEVEFRQEKKAPEGIVYQMYDEYGEKHRTRKRKGSTLGTDFMLQSVEMVIEETKMKEEANAEKFTDQDARDLRGWRETLSSKDANDMVRNFARRKIDELEAKRDKAMGISRDESEVKSDPIIEEPKPKKTEKQAVEEIEEKTPVPAGRHRTEERKGRRPEDEIHEVPVVKPLKDPDLDCGVRSGYDVPWLERLDDETEEQEETAEVAVETVPIEESEISPEMSEQERRKAEVLANYKRLYNQLASREGVILSGGAPMERDEQQK